MAAIGIVEDEKMVAKTLRLTLESLGHEVVFITGNAEEAVNLTNKIIPDLLIIDIQLKIGGNGIDVAEKMSRDIPFIFLTSQTSTDIIKKATNTAPVSYILKPFRKEEIFAALQIGLSVPKNKISDEPNYIFVKKGSSRVRLKISDILYIKSDHIYIEIYGPENKKTLVRESLNSFSQKLPKDLFIRIHQRYLVGKSHVETISKKQVKMADGKNIPISISYSYNISLI